MEEDFQIIISVHREQGSSKVEANARFVPKEVPLDVVALGCSFLMSVVASKGPDGFEKTLESLTWVAMQNWNKEDQK